MGERKQRPQAKPAQTAPSDISERTLPHDLMAERSVLGAIMVNGLEAFEMASERLEPNVFYRDAHRRLFEAMSNIAEKAQEIDLVTVCAELRRTGQLDEVGGPAYVSSLADGVPRSANIHHYADIVQQQHQLRQAIYTGNRLAQEAYLAERPAPEMMADAAEALLDASSSALEGGPLRLSDIISPSMEALEKSAADGGGAVTGIATGFTQLDEMTAGLQPSELVLLAARTSQGKTSLAMNIGRNAALSVNTLVFSLEMSRYQIFLRLLASEARIDGHRIRTGYLNDSDWSGMANALGTLASLNLFIDDTHSVGVREVRARARKLIKEYGSLGLIIIDYIQLMKGRGKFDNRQQEIGTISRGLKGLAKELRVPIVALAQLGRAMEAGPNRKARRPQLHDLRESGDLEQDADSVIFIYRPEPKDDEPNDTAELIIAKQRNGPTGTVKVGWDAGSVTFSNLSMV